MSEDKNERQAETGADDARVNNGTSAQKKPRGRPFQPGNPGRRRGSRNRLQKTIKAELERDLPQVIAMLKEKAIGGHVQAGIALMRNAVPPAKERSEPIRFALPRLEKPADAVNAMAALADGVASGELTPDDAKALAAVVDAFVKAVEVHDHAARLEAIEASIKKGSQNEGH